jgi:hypothetical protein
MKVYCACGGGYDILGIVPFLDSSPTSLVSITFTASILLCKHATKIAEGLYTIQPNQYTGDEYFPEAHLVNALHKHCQGNWECFVIDYAGLLSDTDDDCPCEEGSVCKCDWNNDIKAPSPSPSLEKLMHVFRVICQITKPTVWHLIDGGCDILMTGKEKNLGTPQEDFLTLKCTQLLLEEKLIPQHNNKIHVVGAPLELKDGILESDIIRHTRLADKSWIWELSDPRISVYMDVLQECHPERSTIHSLILASLQGHRGFYTPPPLLKEKMLQTEINLSEEVCTSYEFKLQDVVKRNVALPHIDLKWSLLQYDDFLDELPNYLDLKQQLLGVEEWLEGAVELARRRNKSLEDILDLHSHAARKKGKILSSLVK